jgi:prepilin-type processing-associated H-X9-DG protein
LSYAMSLGLPRGDPRRAPKASEIPMLFDSDLVPVARPSQAAARHGPPGRDSLKQANFAYLDGHVKSVPSDYFGVPPGGKPRAPTGVRKDGR